MGSPKRAIATLFAVAAVGVGAGVPAASAQQIGLINVDVSNVLNNNTVTVQVPVSAAANICGVQVSAILALDTQHVACVARSGDVTAA
jgi:hypothetical protein